MAVRTTFGSTPGSAWINEHRKWVLAAPALVFVGALVVIPIIYTVVLSLTDARGSILSEFSFIGLENYAAVLSDTARFWPAAWRTFAYTTVALSLQMSLGLAIALLLRRPFRGQGIVRVIILLPVVATPVAVGMMWQLILEPNIGVANHLLESIGLPRGSFLGSQSTALVTLAIIDAWQWTPMVTLILLAGLSTLPEEPDEAARVDGATAWQRFRFVTFPLLRPTFFAALALRAVDALKSFDVLYAIKGPGGGSYHEAETLNIYAYSLNFSHNNYGIAATVLTLFVALTLALVTLLIFRRKEVRP